MLSRAIKTTMATPGGGAAAPAAPGGGGGAAAGGGGPPSLVGVQKEDKGPNWKAQIRTKAAGKRTFGVYRLATQHTAAHARDLLLLAKRHVCPADAAAAAAAAAGKEPPLWERLHFSREVYAQLEPQLIAQLDERAVAAAEPPADGGAAAGAAPADGTAAAAGAPAVAGLELAMAVIAGWRDGGELAALADRTRAAGLAPRVLAPERQRRQQRLAGAAVAAVAVADAVDASSDEEEEREPLVERWRRLQQRQAPSPAQQPQQQPMQQQCELRLPSQPQRQQQRQQQRQLPLQQPQHLPAAAQPRLQPAELCPAAPQPPRPKLTLPRPPLQRRPSLPQQQQQATRQPAVPPVRAQQQPRAAAGPAPAGVGAAAARPPAARVSRAAAARNQHAAPAASASASSAEGVGAGASSRRRPAGPRRVYKAVRTRCSVELRRCLPGSADGRLEYAVAGGTEVRPVVALSGGAQRPACMLSPRLAAGSLQAPASNWAPRHRLCRRLRPAAWPT